MTGFPIELEKKSFNIKREPCVESVKVYGAEQYDIYVNRGYVRKETPVETPIVKKELPTKPATKKVAKKKATKKAVKKSFKK